MASRKPTAPRLGVIQRAKNWVYRLVRKVVIAITMVVLVIVAIGSLANWMSSRQSHETTAQNLVSKVAPAVVTSQTPTSKPLLAEVTPSSVAIDTGTPKPESQQSLRVSELAQTTPANSLATSVTATETSVADQLESDDIELVDNVERGTVKVVVYGDYLSIIDKQAKSKQVRLRGIDAPDSGQALYKQSKEALTKLISGKDVEVQWIEQDNTTALIADVYLNDDWINLRMVRDGWAWYDNSKIENYELRDAENEARKAKRGIWAMNNPISPWAYRANKHDKESIAFAKAAEARETKKQAEVAKQEQETSTNIGSVASSSSHSTGGAVSVKGHYRTSNTGKTYYVQPHTRRK